MNETDPEKTRKWEVREEFLLHACIVPVLQKQQKLSVGKLMFGTNDQNYFFVCRRERIGGQERRCNRKWQNL